jgi:oxygen-independent coproporphyrinogen-3 oxidase
VDRLIEDLHSAPAWAANNQAELPRAIDTVYLGGGTPSLLAPELIERLFAAIRSSFDLLPDAEITFECAPAQLSDPTLAAMVRVGVNRASLGVQSFIDSEARASGRLHTRASTLETIVRLRQVGIQNLSVDLIAGLGGQTIASWAESLDLLIETAVPHASVYMLEVDEDSRLGRELLSGGTRYSASLVPRDEVIIAMYEQAIARLADSGLPQYEISNFSRQGWESRHNLRYWQRRPYLGLGLDASSALRLGDSVLRSTTTDDLKAYLEAPHWTETLWLGKARQQEEAWFLGLRTNAGVRINEIETEFGADPAGRDQLNRALAAVQRLATDGLLAFDGQTVRLTPQGRLLSNQVFAEFLEDSPKASPGKKQAD